MGDLEFSITIVSDDDGFFDRRCPAEHCRYEFKVLMEHWENDVGDDAVCPRCGHVVESTFENWCTQQQVDAVNQIVVEQGEHLVTKMLMDQFRGMRSSKYVKITVPRPRPRPPIPAVRSSEVLRRQVSCAACGVKYAVVGSAFFCPSCGHNSAEETFEEALAKMKAGLDLIAAIRDTTLDMDAAETLVRRQLESTVSDGVVALQRLPQALYDGFTGVAPAPHNVFQRLGQASTLWEQATGESYEDMLDPDEWADLKLLFQQRHLLQHADGFVDQKYIDRSGDQRYQPGQRLVVSEQDARRMLHLATKLGAGLRRTASDSS